jgi:hypothetical protein
MFYITLDVSKKKKEGGQITLLYDDESR